LLIKAISDLDLGTPGMNAFGFGMRIRDITLLFAHRTSLVYGLISFVSFYPSTITLAFRAGYVGFGMIIIFPIYRFINMIPAPLFPYDYFLSFPFDDITGINLISHVGTIEKIKCLLNQGFRKIDIII
jgi:hypothetical protein